MKKLFVLFLVLLATYFGMRFWPEESTAIDDVQVFRFSDKDVQSFSLIQKNVPNIEFRKQENKWFFIQDGHSSLADQQSISGILHNLQNLVFKKVVSPKDVQLASEKSILLELDLKKGREQIRVFPLNPANDSLLGYVRLNNQTEIYEVDPKLYWSVSLPANNFKDKKVLDIEKDRIRVVDVQTQNDTVSFTKRASHWHITDNYLDTILLEPWIAKLEPIYGSKFYDNEPDSIIATLNLLDNRGSSFDMSFFKSVDSSVIIVQNNYNPGAYFLFDKSIYNRLVDSLLRHKPDKVSE